MVAHAYNSSNLRGIDWENYGLRSAQKISKTPSQQTSQVWQ
jgi:hypothetical protein